MSNNLTPVRLARISTDPTGSTASLYYNSTTNTIKFYNGTTWITLLSGNNASLFWRFTATGGETTLSGLDSGSQTLLYTEGYEQVFLNGVMLIRGTDYTATDGSTISLASALLSGDYIVVLAVVSSALVGGGGGGTTTNALTIGTGLSGTSFNGSSAVTIANTGVLSINGNSGVITGIANSADVHYIGTTSIALNRSSASQALTGVSIDGNAGTVTNGIYTTTTSLPNVTSVRGTTIPSSSNLVTSVDSSLSIPTQSSNSGKYLTTNGSILSWATVSGGSSFGNLDGGLASSTYGGVTSIDAGTA